MQQEASLPTFPWSDEFLKALDEGAFRTAYLSDQVRTNIAFQIRALRDQRGWTQSKLAEKAGKPANSISRLEDPDYGKLTLTTLLEIAEAFDVALLVQFTEHDDWLNRMNDVSPAALQKRSFSLSRLLALARASRVDAQPRQQPALHRDTPGALSGSFPFHGTMRREPVRQPDPLSGRPREQSSVL
jgi:transcriptional regulator with XRE-family HTH domain